MQINVNPSHPRSYSPPCSQHGVRPVKRWGLSGLRLAKATWRTQQAASGARVHDTNHIFYNQVCVSVWHVKGCARAPMRITMGITLHLHGSTYHPLFPWLHVPRSDAA